MQGGRKKESVVIDSFGGKHGADLVFGGSSQSTLLVVNLTWYWCV